MQIVSVDGPNIAACLAAARRKLGLKFKDSREALRSGGEDGPWRVTLANRTVVECTIRPRTVTGEVVVIMDPSRIDC